MKRLLLVALCSVACVTTAQEGEQMRQDIAALRAELAALRANMAALHTEGVDVARK